MALNSPSTDNGARQLTIAIWAVAIALAANAVVAIIPWLFPPLYISRFTEPTELIAGNIRQSELSPDNIFPISPQVRPPPPPRPFHRRSIEEQIEQSSMVAIAEFEKGNDGRKKAIIREILKKDPGVSSQYSVGREHTMSSYYPAVSSHRGDGVIIFFTGSPPRMARSLPYEHGRILSLGDIQLAQFKEKFSD